MDKEEIESIKLHTKIPSKESDKKDIFQWYFILAKQVILEIMAIYPAWRHAWKDSEEIHNSEYAWAEAIIESEVCSFREIHNGLKRCRADISPFIPSPGQFIKWCLLEEEEYLPSLNKSLCESQKNIASTVQ